MSGLKLYWLRHGIAEDKRPGQTDAERRLTPEGRREVQEVATALRPVLRPQRILCSPLIRAVETAAIAGEALGIKDEPLICDGLLPQDDWNVLFPALKAMMPMQSVLLVGHQPGIGHTIGHLAAGPGRSGVEIPLKKAGCCRVDIDVLGPRPAGELVWLLNPKILRKITAY